MQRLFSILFFLFILIVLTPNKVIASSKFDVKTDISYVVASDGRATVSQNFNLTNLTSEYAPAQYVFQPGLTQFDNVRAFNSNGPLPVSATQKDGRWEITVNLPGDALGIGKSQIWTVVYESSEVLRKNGRLWELFVPKPADLEGLKDLSLSLDLPSSVGRKALLWPNPTSGDFNHLVWSKTDLKGSVIGAFDPSGGTGEVYQAYDFKLRYPLNNNRLYPVKAEISLPGDTTYQKVYITDIDPKPINVVISDSGAWKGQYQLGPASNLDVTVTGTVAVFAQPRFPPEQEIMPEKFLGTQTYWETNDRQLILLAQQLRTPANIYQFVVNNIGSGADNNPDRAGAKKTLASRQGGSVAANDLFVALSRAAGIPAREVFGYWIGSDANPNPIVWSEFLDPNRNAWVAADPSLGRTNGSNFLDTLDFKHLSLGNNGPDSSLTDLPSVELNFHPGKIDFSQNAKVGLRVDVPKEIIAGFPAEATVYVENYGPGIYTGQIVTLGSSDLGFRNPGQATGVLPPFSNHALKFSVIPTGWMTSQNDIITLDFDREHREYSTRIKPFYKNSFLLTISILFSLGILSLIAQIARSLFLPGCGGNHHLRRQSPQSEGSG